jgi:hypothetical protein
MRHCVMSDDHVRRLTHFCPSKGMDIVNIQHRLFASTWVVMAVSLIQEARGRWRINNQRLTFPVLVMLLALQLAGYTE